MSKISLIDDHHPWEWIATFFTWIMLHGVSLAGRNIFEVGMTDIEAIMLYPSLFVECTKL